MDPAAVLEDEADRREFIEQLNLNFPIDSSTRLSVDERATIEAVQTGFEFNTLWECIDDDSLFQKFTTIGQEYIGQRDSQIDELERVSFIEKIRSAPETTPEEKKMLMCSLVFAENIAFLWFYCSNLKMKEHQKNEGKTLLRTVYNPENYEDNVDGESRKAYVETIPSVVEAAYEQQSFVQQEMDYIDYKDDNGWEKLDKDSSVFVKLLMQTVGNEIRHTATKRKFLMSLGASLASICDVGFDVSTIIYYRSLGKYETAT
ncbi:hypothetical protein ScalyP_jg9202 [Parmales sp. scaly parma]|nr:hypothetical protein ScalyP_jg9202 [Parmales sp. scaly parma]